MLTWDQVMTIIGSVEKIVLYQANLLYGITVKKYNITLRVILL